MAPGADDNASGVAVMIELARICHANNLHFRRDIHFMAYDGEELGLYGSYADAQKRSQAGDKIAIMLNNDMVSFQPDDNWRVTLHWYDNALDIVNRAAELCAQYTNIDVSMKSVYTSWLKVFHLMGQDIPVWEHITVFGDLENSLILPQC